MSCSRHPGVSASVVNKFSLDNNDFLCGYYVTDGTTEVSELEVKNYLKILYFE